MSEPTVERLRALLRLLGDDHITPTGRRQIERVLDDTEVRIEGPSDSPVTPGYPTFDEWRERFNALGPKVHRALYEKALLACPKCAWRGVPMSYAVVAAETVLAAREPKRTDKPNQNQER